MLNNVITPINKFNNVVSNVSNYVVEFNKFLEKIIKYKTTMPDAYEKFVSLYELLFQIMDIAMALNEPCILKNIIQSTISKSILFKNILSQLLSLASDPVSDPDTDIDEFIEELQIDVDLIQNKGFGAFEKKIMDMFNEFEEDNKQFDKLLQSFDDLHNIMIDR